MSSIFQRVIILLFVFSLMNAKPVNANHIYGFDAQWKNLGYDTFQVRVVLYMDCAVSSGNSLGSAIVIISDSCSSNFNFTINANSTSVTEATPVCSGVTTRCSSIPIFPFGVWKKEILVKVFLGGAYANCCWYKIRVNPSSFYSTINTNIVNAASSDILLNRCISDNTSVMLILQ